VTYAIELDGRRALVTGGGKGVGRAIGLTLAAAGAVVLVNDFVPERAKEVVAEIEAAGGVAQALPFDVADHASVAAAVESAGSVDILVNNAGMAGAVPEGTAAPRISVGPFAESDPADWDRYFGVNLFGVLYCSHAVLPGMIARGEGRIVTIVSDAARVGERNMAPYAAAKGGAAAFSRALALEVGRSGVTVNNVALASVDTMGLAAMAEADPQLAERLRKTLKQYAVPRMGQPEDVAGLVTFLASPAASWITGQTYPVNGGYSVTQ
jgi:NAD(P)-dependent dehydrogenase (short-subunit alcohol dehydrogenase family)